MKKIVSGGQTGVDQAALDAAKQCGISHGGWVPPGRKTENGPLAMKYEMLEMTSGSYPERTRQNVIDSDATLLLSRGSLSGGTSLTRKFAVSYNKPYLHIDFDQVAQRDAVTIICRWLVRNDFSVLNVAGPRASSDHSIYEIAFDCLCLVLCDDVCNSK